MCVRIGITSLLYVSVTVSCKCKGLWKRMPLLCPVMLLTAQRDRRLADRAKMKPDTDAFFITQNRHPVS
jgi:hypothetical protein